jgi:methyltransferase family protein
MIAARHRMTSITPNAQYNVAAADSIPVRLAAFQRRKMFARFLADTAIEAHETVLDIGATSDTTYEASNYLERWYPHKHMITALGLDDASFLCAQYPGLRFVRGDAFQLPFRDEAFDVLHASAVIEHVGSFARQCAFVRECCRVARRAVFITTPNRWFPVEFHTVLPLVHWLPKPVFRSVMRRSGRAFFAEEANLNLMDEQDLRDSAAASPGFAYQVTAVSLAGLRSNLLLSMHRAAVS